MDWKGFFIPVVSYGSYGLLIVVSSWTIYQIIQAPLKQQIWHLRYRAEMRRRKESHRQYGRHDLSPFFQHLYFLLSARNKEVSLFSVWGFVVISAFIGVVTAILILLKFEDAFMALVIGSIVSLFPYAYLHIRLRNTRQLLGSQLTHITEMMVHNYNACSFDIYQTLNMTVAMIDNQQLKRIFTRLIHDIQTARSEEEMRFAIELFIYTCGNSWSKRLGNIILKSYLYHENVLNTLLTLQMQMVNTEKMLEQERSLSMDAFANAMLIIIVLPCSLVLGDWATNPQDWMKLQFGYKWSFLLFIVMIVMSIISVMIGFIIRKPKNDI
jgi:hypothetical protein